MKKQALEKFLNEKVNQTADNIFESVDYVGEYLVLTEEEANEKAKEEILNSLWAFRPEFIIEHIKNYDDLDSYQLKSAIKALEEAQKKSCESLNGLIFALIDDIDLFIENAIEADGRGHFISWYDGQENEENGFYIYRIN